MEKVFSQLTVLFEDPFWILLYERNNLYERKRNAEYEVCKITFGAEPKDYEVYAFLLKNYNRFSFSPPIKNEKHEEKKINPKRLQRLVNRQLQNTQIGTKAQQALKLLQEENKTERKLLSREKREEDKERKFNILKLKRLQKHKGH